VSESDEREPARVITDEEFLRQLFLLRRTRHFLIAEGVPAITPSSGGESPFSLGRLNLIRRLNFPVKSRLPTLEDWLLLEEKQAGLQSLFNTELQYHFRLQATQRMITGLPVLLLLVAFAALFVAVFPPHVLFTEAAWRFDAYLMWTSCLGGLGAIGFLAVNSLAIQHDATFDMSNQGLVAMRIVLGMLFGSIVSLPFCFPYFKEFTGWVLNGGDLDARHGVLLLVPFLLGFSTSLVMAVLNRMARSIETLFGIERSSIHGAPPRNAEIGEEQDARKPVGPATKGKSLRAAKSKDAPAASGAASAAPTSPGAGTGITRLR
jgi:hypothetical protein